jgi:hypothetical protein
VNSKVNAKKQSNPKEASEILERTEAEAQLEVCLPMELKFKGLISTPTDTKFCNENYLEPRFQSSIVELHMPYNIVSYEMV